VFPPDAVKEVDAPEQMVAEAGVTFIVGIGFTVTTTVCVFVQPDAVPVTVYVVVEAGFAVTVAVFVLFSPAAGLQE
jgi:hypothetical protein